MDQYIVRYEDRTRFAAIRSKRMAKAVQGLRTHSQLNSEETVVALDQSGNVISLKERAEINPKRLRPTKL